MACFLLSPRTAARLRRRHLDLRRAGAAAHRSFIPLVRDESEWEALYDEKIHLSDKLKYDAKKPECWLQDVKDYIAGRSPDLDQL